MLNIKQAPHLQALLLLILAMLSVQGSGSFAKVLISEFPVITVAALRLMFSALILAAVFQIWKVNLRNIRWKAILSYGLALAGMNLLFYLSIARLPLGIAVAFEFIGPLSVALFFARQRYDFIWIGLAVLGLLLLLPLDETQQSLDLLGVAYALGAGACWAVYIIAGQKPSGISGNHTVCLGMMVGTCCLLPAALLFTPATLSAFELPHIGSFIVLAILASALPFSLEMIALRNLTALSFGTLMSLEPAIAAFSGFLFLDEQLLWSQWLALVTIIAASIGCTVTTQRARLRAQAKNSSASSN